MAETSFAQVAEEHLDAVYAFLLYLTGDRAVADDLTGETFERAFSRWRRFDPRRGTAKTWLCQIARSTALDHFRSESRRRRREEAYAVSDVAVAGETLGEGLSPELEAALQSLSPGEREVIALRVVCDLDGDTAARVLGISRTACSTRLSRALQKLEEKVRDDVLA
ncbi:MAG TPA: sigma-70 family RNA polymerase sigma factor [Gaiellaceae bacterium]|nr:sigma-70 family RNA polymerase sigma factor [Gaiellaceae bacterium]